MVQFQSINGYTLNCCTMKTESIIIWTDEFSIGNAHIDKENIHIIELYNEMAEILNLNFDRSIFAEVLSGMFD